MNYSGRLADVSASSDEPVNPKPVRVEQPPCGSSLLVSELATMTARLDVVAQKFQELLERLEV